MPDDVVASSESIGAGGGDDAFALVAGVVLNKRLADVGAGVETKKCGTRKSVVKGVASETIDSSPRPDNIRVNVRSWHWAKRRAI